MGSYIQGSRNGHSESEQINGLQTGSCGQGHCRFPAVGAQPGLRAPGMPGGGVWAGVEAAVKGRASEGGLSPIIHLSL